MGQVLQTTFDMVDIAAPFFDSLKSGYAEFEDWFGRKAKAKESCIIVANDAGVRSGFLYLKVEDGKVDDVNPPLPPARRVKIGTLKVDAHGTKLGERFLKKSFDYAISNKCKDIYVTVFDKHQKLIEQFERYGFSKIANKSTINGVENVMIRSLKTSGFGDDGGYPMLGVGKSNWLVSIYPKWHTRLFPDSILKTENYDIVKDISHTNSIQKVYLASMNGMQQMKAGDNVLIYRTGDGVGAAEYRLVVTSVCRLKEYKNINEFKTCDEFRAYCEPYSVFTIDELNDLYKSKKFFHVIRFTYNFALNKKITRHDLIEKFGIDRQAYAGFMKIGDNQMLSICKQGGVDEDYFVN